MPHRSVERLLHGVERSDVFKFFVKSRDGIVRKDRWSLHVEADGCIFKVTRDPISPLDAYAGILREITQKPLEFTAHINNLAERRALSTLIQHNPDA
jgi:hypothetical protein